MRGSLLAYSLGVMVATFVLQPGVVLWFSGAALGLLLACFCLSASSHSYWFKIWRLLAVALLGFSWHLLWAQCLLQQRLPVDLEGQDMWVNGTVVDLPSRTSNALQFQFFVEESDADFSRRRILLNYYGQQTLETGQRWRLLVRLNRPHGFANPGGFDYEAWLLQQLIVAKGYVRDHPDNQLLGRGQISVQQIRFRLRERMLEIAQQLPNLGILLALSLGDRSRLEASDWLRMSESGTNHLFVISGLHIGLIAAAAYWLVGALVRLAPAVTLHWPRQKIAAWFGLVAALLYSLLAGFTLPTQRAFIMTAVFVLGHVSNRPVSMSLRFLMALALVLTVNPLAVVSAGFWLSFGAVAALMICLEVTSTQTSLTSKIWQSWIKPQLAVFLALLPLLAVWTQQAALLAPIINLIAIPLIGLLVVPLCLAGAGLLFVHAPIALMLLTLADWLLTQSFAGLTWITSHAPWSVIKFGAPPLPATVFLLLGVGLLLLPLRLSLRYLSLPLLLPLVLPVTKSIASGAVDIHILDVGQGLSVIIQTAEHALVYDTGAALSPEFDLGTAVVVPVLRQLGVAQLDTVVISHFDNDHAGGLVGLLKSVPVLRVLSSDPDQAAERIENSQARLPAITSQLCSAGDGWEWDGVEFSILHPQSRMADANNNSCVLWMRTATQSLLLPGDIEQASERRLAQDYGTILRSDILVAPHHGSNTSSTYAFIKQVAPHYVVFTAGYRNSFGHPTPRTRQRYTELGSRIYTTHATGSLHFRLRPGQPLAEPAQFRQQRRRYWH